MSACLALAWHSPAQALERPSSSAPPPSALQLQNASQLGNHLVAPHLAKRLNVELELLRGASGGVTPLPGAAFNAAPSLLESSSTLPSTGNVKVLALLISFQDYPASVAVPTVQSMLFGDGDAKNYPNESLRRYYERSSYGQLSMTGNTLGWYAAGKRSTVSETRAGKEALIKQALNSYDAAGHDFSQYDNDGDGVIDYLIVMWTGPTGEWASFWWGNQPRWQDGSYTLDGKRLGDYSWQWEENTPTIVIHETGHALGLPDYYDYKPSVGPRGGLGGLDMMDANVGDHNCFSKFLLGWLTLTHVGDGSNQFSLQPASLDGECLLITPGCPEDKKNMTPFREFYLVENRTRTDTGNDRNLRGNGVLIWHVDGQLDSGGGFVNNNSDTNHKLIRVMEADGLEEIENGGSGDGNDFWSNWLTFNASSVPACNYYDGSACPFELANFSAPGAPMTFDVSYPTPQHLSQQLYCVDPRFVEIDPSPLCAIVDCNLERPGGDVINPPDLSIREQITPGTPVIGPQVMDAVNPSLPANGVVQATKAR